MALRQALLSSALVAGLCLGVAHAAPDPATAPLYAASFKDFNRQMQPLSQYEGKTLVLYFWATWCKSCVAEVPELKSVFAKYKSKNATVVGIAVDNADKVQQFVKDHGIEYPMYVGGNEALALSKQLGNAVGGLPFVVVVDAKGRIIERILGETPKGKLEGVLKPLLG